MLRYLLLCQSTSKVIKTMNIKMVVERLSCEVKLTHKEARKFAYELLESLIDNDEGEIVLESASGEVTFTIGDSE